jgi:hypothetical protein
VRGLPPTADEFQFIDREPIKEAQLREPQSLLDGPLVCGVDVSGGGAARNVAAFRCGGDTRSIPRVRIPGAYAAIAALASPRQFTAGAQPSGLATIQNKSHSPILGSRVQQEEVVERHQPNWLRC